MQTKNKKQIFTAIIAVLISVGLVATAVYAVTTVGDDVDVGDALTVAGNVTLGNADSDQLTVNASTTFATGTIFSGAITANGNFTANGGTLTLGDADSDALTVNASTTFATGTIFTGDVTIGGGTAITKHISATTSINFSDMASSTCTTTGSITVTGAAAGDTVIATPEPVTSGIETLTFLWNSYASTTNEVAIRACNVGTANQDPAAQTWRFDVWRH